MRCQNCHEIVPDNAKVCGHCGIKLNMGAYILCPSCGEDIPVTAKVCGYCGIRLEEKHSPLAINQTAAESKIVKKQAATRKIEEKASTATNKVKTAADKKAERETKSADKAKAEKKTGKKFPGWIFGVIAIAIAAGAYFLFFQYSPSVDCLNGSWAGDVVLDGENVFKIYFDITQTCQNNAYCGKFSIPQFDANGRIKITDVKGSKFYFLAEPNVGKPETEMPEEFLQCKKDGTLFYKSIQNNGSLVQSGTLNPN